MKDIKTKETHHAPKVLSAASRAPREAARRAALSAKRQARETAAQPDHSDSPVVYAEDRVADTAKEVGYRGARAVVRGGKRTVQDLNDLRKQIKEKRSHESGSEETGRGREPGDASVRQTDGDAIRTRDSASPKTAEQRIRTADNAPRQSGEKSIHTKEHSQPAREPLSRQASVKPKTGEAASRKGARRTVNRSTRTARRSVKTTRQTAETAKTTARSAKQTAQTARTTAQTGKTAAKGTVKAARHTVKTAKSSVKTAKATVKTTQKTVKTTQKVAQKAAQAAGKAAKAAAKAAQIAAKAAVKAAQIAIKVVTAIIKAIAAAVKALIAAIAAGGWIVVLIAIVAALVIVLLSALGVFGSNDTADGSRPMTEAIQQLEAEFSASIESKIAELSAGGSYDTVEVKYLGDSDGDSDYTICWDDVIAVYAVVTTTDADNPMEVVEFTPEKGEILRRVFYDMNSVSYDTETATYTETEPQEAAAPDAPDDGEGGDDEEEPAPKTKLTIKVTVTCMDAWEAADLYSFDDVQREMLEVMTDSSMLPYYTALIGIDIGDGEDLTDIISHLPPGENGSAIVEAALKRLGDPYSKSKRGTGRFVDCSYLAHWAYKQVGITIPGTAASQAEWCKNKGYAVGKSELQPGDLIFWTKPSCHCGRWNEIHHVGIYAGNGKCVEASSGKGRVVLRGIWEGAGYKLFMYARPG